MFMNHALHTSTHTPYTFKAITVTRFGLHTIDVNSLKCLLKWRNNWIHFIHISLISTLWHSKSAFHMQKFNVEQEPNRNTKQINQLLLYLLFLFFYVDEWREALTIKWVILNAKSFSMKWVCKLTSFADDGPWNGRVIRTNKSQRKRQRKCIYTDNVYANKYDRRQMNERTNETKIHLRAKER